jgi:hypothetical protein
MEHRCSDVSGKEASMFVAHLPALDCPFPQGLSPHVVAIEAHTLTWVQHFHLVPEPASAYRFRMAQFGALAAATHPTAPCDVLCLLADWCAWLFILDDYCDESGLGKHPDALAVVHRRLLAILRGAHLTPQDDALAQSLADLRQRTTPYGTMRWMRRFTAQIAAYFAAGVWEARNRAAQIIPDTVSYLAMRPYTGGLFAYVELLSATTGVKLPHIVAKHPAIQQLTSLANTVICWANDLLSYERERLQGDVHNLVLVVQHEQHLTLPQAIAWVSERHNTEMRAFLEIEATLSQVGVGMTTELNQYLALLRAMIRGSFDWAYTTDRHSVAERAVGE